MYGQRWKLTNADCVVFSTLSPVNPALTCGASKTGRDVVDIIQKLAKEEGCSVLLVTHDNRILDIADRIIHMEDGKLQGAVSS